MTGRPPPTLALALGGGGAAGLGHLGVLDALDELGIRPVAISGTSMGALIGACYAAGLSAAEIRAHVQDLADHPVRTTARLSGSLGFGGWGQFPALDPLKIVTGVLPGGVPEVLEDLTIPFCAIVTDYHRRAEVPQTRGPLRPAIAASIAIPGVFRPQMVAGRVCIDGGVTNNLPYDRLPPADVVLAVDVATADPTDADTVPSPTEVSVGAVRILMSEQLEAQLARGSPDVLIRPLTRRFGPLDFDKAARILATKDTAHGATLAALRARGIGG